jgi:formylglycine-generating enzyme required for sulfatase activity
LAELFNQGAYWLRAPGRLARRDMILGPARRAGLQLEGGDSGALVQRLIDETGEEPGALPLMAYALQELFDRDGGLGVLTLASYDAFGGVPGAIARTAEAVFGEFAEQQGQDTAQQALQVLFRELVDVRDAVAPPTRRRARNDDLCAGDEEAAALADRFKAKRLLVTDREIAAPPSATVRGAAGEAVVEVAHEALLTRWERLSHWIESRRNQFWLRERLRRDSADWQAAGYPTKLLPSVERARDLRDALTVLGQAPSDAERAFLDPVFRARWLLAEDLSAWRKVREAGDPDADRPLWSADRLRGFADIDAYLEADAASENGGDAAQPAANAPQSYVREPGPLLPDQTPEQREFLRASFERAVAAPELHDTPKLRAALGNALANLGDPRFDPDHWWLPDDAAMGFRHVPAGRFLMGSPKGEGWDDEWEQHALDLPDFWIGRWPVTVAQWVAFVEVTGHDANPISLDARPNHPAVLVSWHDARAYTDWLGEQMQAEAANRADQASDEGAHAFWRAVADGKVHCGLPSEAEWEKAARGTDARRYPFGDAINPALANYQDTRIGTTSAVGCFPAGAGPYGCEEQAGNVWEWTRSLWGDDWNMVRYRYRYQRDDGRENLDAGNDVLRVRRGGAFDLDNNYCRSAVRSRSNPLNRITNVGFRVVWSPLL